MVGPTDCPSAQKDAVRARLDDLTQDGLATDFGVPERTLVADRPAEVVPLLEAIEVATTDGWWAVGFLAYEAATGLDPTLATRQARPDEQFRDLPLAWFGLFADPRSVEPLQQRALADRGYQVSSWRPDVDGADYRGKVDVVRHLIQEGETYQCNLSLSMRSHVDGDLFELYRDLALAQRGAHNAYLDAGRFVVASASPELFFDWTGDRLTARPMKGTAPRGRWSEEDAAKARELVGSTKERAENVMIVDLLRNDLGKVAESGSVEVPDLFTRERFETLWQLTSTVTARARHETSLVDVLRALFPCGSVTGAPKARTMALIAELEQSRRGVYCGAVGVVAPPGTSFRARFSVAIRTVVVDRLTGEAVYGTGGGITWDSIPRAEHDELVAKTAILHAIPEEFQLLETMAFRPGDDIRNRGYHMERLTASAEYFGFQLDLVQVSSELCDALRGVRRASRVRLLVDRRGVVTVEIAPMPLSAQGKIRLAVDLEPVRSSDVWLYHKTTRRADYRTRAARHPDVDDVIMVNERGEVTESTVANLAVRLDGRWYTPPLEAGCLPGVGRRLALDSGRLQERVIGLEDLTRAEEIALVSSLRGWRAAGFDSSPSA
ncbi:MAG: aminodeoxychorismate synthase component I [Candidatus Dormiibacterota bacterium]